MVSHNRCFLPPHRIVAVLLPQLLPNLTLFSLLLLKLLPRNEARVLLLMGVPFVASLSCACSPPPSFIQPSTPSLCGVPLTAHTSTAMETFFFNLCLRAASSSPTNPPTIAAFLRLYGTGSFAREACASWAAIDIAYQLGAEKARGVGRRDHY